MDATSPLSSLRVDRATVVLPGFNMGTALLKTFLIILFVSLISAAYATSFKCSTPPKAGGTFTLGVKSFTEKCDPIKVHIPAGSTSQQKAERIKNAINRSCANIFTATVDGDRVTVTNAVHPNQRVFFRFGPDDTGEKDRIEDDLTPAWWKIFSTAPLYTVSASASGVSFDGVSPGSITIGTSTHTATILTFPGMTPQNILDIARMQLMAFDVPNVNIEEIEPGTWGLTFGVTPGDSFVEFGNDDSGLVCIFEMFEETSAEFVQLNFNYDGTETLHSDWGAIDLTFSGSNTMFYLNLSVNGSWVIQNVPFQSLQSNGELQTRRFWFPIGSPGIEVEQIIYGYTVTPVMMLNQPFEDDIALVEQDYVEIYSSFFDPTGDPSLNVPDPAVNQVGGKPAQKTHSHRLFPNQEAGVNECVPTGISNSLKFLKDHHGLIMTEDDMSIDSLKIGTGWTALGCPRPGWVDNKKNYVRDKKLPVTTRKLDGPKNIASIGQEIKDGQDVEMDIKWKGRGAHAVAITEWIDLGGGRYQIGVTHDKEQGTPGGTVTENAIYDSNTGTWTGAMSNGTNDFFFVVECPTTRVINSVPGTVSMPPGQSYIFKTNSDCTFGDGVFELRNLSIFNIFSTATAPPPGGTIIFSYSCNAFYEFSFDGGLTFNPVFQEVIIMQRATNLSSTPDETIIDTEIISMSLDAGGIVIETNPEQPSLGFDRIFAYPSGYLVDSFFDIAFHLSPDGGLTWLPADNGSTLLEIDGSKITNILEVDNLVLEAGEFGCLNAVNEVVLSGNIHVMPDASLNVVSGGKIMIMHELHAHEGSYFRAHITGDIPWCLDDLELSSDIFVDEQTDITVPELFQLAKEEKFFSAYPNPTPGHLTLELHVSDEFTTVTVEIYSIIGERITKQELPAMSQYEFDLSNHQPGIYLIRVMMGDEVGVERIIKQ
jgi:hypothetical protein